MSNNKVTLTVTIETDARGAAHTMQNIDKLRHKRYITAMGVRRKAGRETTEIINIDEDRQHRIDVIEGERTAREEWEQENARRIQLNRDALMHLLLEDLGWGPQLQIVEDGTQIHVRGYVPECILTFWLSASYVKPYKIRWLFEGGDHTDHSLDIDDVKRLLLAGALEAKDRMHEAEEKRRSHEVMPVLRRLPRPREVAEII